MIVARLDGQLARAVAGARGECPECRNAVYARLPENAIRHWAHMPLPDGETRDCTNDAGEMSEWHRAWQDLRADVACIEVYRDGFRADAINEAGIVIEFQHSPISPEAVAAREAHWGRGMWVLDGTDVDGRRRVVTTVRPDQAIDDPWRRFTWPKCPQLLFRAKWPCWVDLGDRGLLQVHSASAAGGNGWIASWEWFVAEVLNGTRTVLRRHDPQRTADRIKGAPRRPGHARAETEQDLRPLVQHCDRVPSPLVALLDRPSPVVLTRQCVYGCVAGARFYPCGWRCDEHAPGRSAA